MERLLYCSILTLPWGYTSPCVSPLRGVESETTTLMKPHVALLIAKLFVFALIAGEARSQRNRVFKMYAERVQLYNAFWRSY